jgi:hypothetical protein
LLRQFWRFAVLTYGWNADPDQPPQHRWNWPKHPVADVEAEANATKTKLSSGQTTLTRVYEDAGLDFEEEVVVMAGNYGLPVPEMRKLLCQAIFTNGNPLPGDRPQVNQGGVA